MVGAGVFVAFGPAAALAGNGLWIAIVLAGAVAYLNAGSIAQLAAVIPRSGGAYSYAREYLGPSFGFLAGVAFLVGKTASIAAIALVVASYLGLGIWFAVLAIFGMTTINLLGINRTALGAKVLSSVTLVFLGVVLAVSLFLPQAQTALPQGTPLGVMGAAGLLFFAFAGYARVATLGSEVEDPKPTIPKAIAISLGLVLVLYLALGLVLGRSLGAGLGSSETPIADLSALANPGLLPLVALVAAIAGLGSLLALLAGMGRTAGVMAQDGELPKLFAKLNRKNAPFIAELTVGFFASVLILSGSVVFAISLSSFSVLTYYAIANLAALAQPRSVATRSKLLIGLGLALCVAIAVSLPPQSVLIGVVVLGLSLGLRYGMAKLS